MENSIARRLDWLPPSGIRKVNEKALVMERAGEHVIHFELGYPDFDTPKYIKQAAVESLNKGEVFYTSNFGTDDLRSAIAEKLSRENGLHYDLNEILVTVGLSEAVFDALCAILDEGDELLVPDPVWMNYSSVSLLLGAVPVSYTLKEETGYQLNSEEIRAMVGPKTKALVIVSPNNPTGAVLSEDSLKALVDIAVENNIWVISDEIYERLIYDGAQHVSIASFVGMKERTIVLNGFSKAYAMTGWRVGYAAAPREMISAMNRIHQHNTACAPSFVQSAAAAALRREGSEVRDMVEEYQRRRDFAVAVINGIEGLHCNPPQGAFYIFVNAKALGVTSAWLSEYLLTHAKVAVVPGDVFGKAGAGYLRISFVNSLENIAEGCRRLKQSIEALRLKHR